MTANQVHSIALERLQTHGRLLHSQLLIIAGGDESLMRDVSNRLVQANLAVDKFGVVLVAVATPASPPSTELGTSGSDSAEANLLPPNGDSLQPPPKQTKNAEASEVLRYVFWNSGRESESFPREELEQRLADGRLQPADFVRVESEDEWIPVSTALGRTGAPPTSSPDRKTSKSDANRSPSTKSPAKEIAVAKTSALAGATAARQAAQPKSKPDVISLPGDGIRPSQASWNSLTPQECWNWLKQNSGKGRLRNGITIVLLVLGGWVYWTWPPAAKTISAEFHQYVFQLEGIEALHGPSPSSPAWQEFVKLNQPRIKRLVESLKPRVNAAHPADRELFYAGEEGLLPLLREGLHGAAHTKFSKRWQKAVQILHGTVPADKTLAGATAHGGPPSPTLVNSIIPSGVPSTNRVNPHDMSRPTQ